MYYMFSSLVVIGLSGCQFTERGMSLPAPKVKPRPQPKDTVDYDFPLLKLKAHAASSEKAETKKDQNKESTSKSTSNSFINVFKNLLGDNTDRKLRNKSSNDDMETKNETNKKVQPPKRIKESTKNKVSSTSSIKVVKDKKSRKRKSGHANKLIFNKNTSLKDIPLPFPKLSSLNLKSLSKTLPSIPVSKIPILNTIIPEGSKTSSGRIKKHSNRAYSAAKQNNHTKNTSSKKLDMANIRIGKSSDYTTLIFDSYIWGGYNTASTQEASSSGNYEFKYEPENNRIVASIQGYSAFSALLGDQSKLFNQSDVVKSIYIDRYINENNIQFIIELKRQVKITVLDVQDPGRIVVTLYPKK